jgi:hypothetical protein
MTEKREIPIYCEEFAYGEILYEDEPANSFYPCPITGNNILDQEHPDELLAYFDNLMGEVTHISPLVESIHEAFLAEEDCFESDFIEYLIEHLPVDTPLYCLVISHPEGVSGDFVELLYKGVYTREWIPVND